jgi:serine/threonine protein kinase
MQSSRTLTKVIIQSHGGIADGVEMANRRAFVDFVQGLLNLDPLLRWTPQQAAKHPFITGEKFTAPFQVGLLSIDHYSHTAYRGAFQKVHPDRRHLHTASYNRTILFDQKIRRARPEPLCLSRPARVFRRRSVQSTAGSASSLHGSGAIRQRRSPSALLPWL